MPFFPLPSGEGSLFYSIGLTSNEEEALDPSKPTVLVLPPPWTDSSVVQQQFLEVLAKEKGGKADEWNWVTMDLRRFVHFLFPPATWREADDEMNVETAREGRRLGLSRTSMRGCWLLMSLFSSYVASFPSLFLRRD
jgi:hypothetical protein